MKASRAFPFPVRPDQIYWGVILSWTSVVVAIVVDLSWTIQALGEPISVMLLFLLAPLTFLIKVDRGSSSAGSVKRAISLLGTSRIAAVPFWLAALLYLVVNTLT